MKYYILFVLAVYGVYYLGSKNVHGPKDALVYAQKHPESPWSPKINYYVGMMYYHHGDFPEAQTAFTQLLMEYPTTQFAPKALLALGIAAEENRDFGLAKSSFNRLLERYSEELKSEDLEVARKKFELLKYHHGATINEFPAKEEKSP